MNALARAAVLALFALGFGVRLIGLTQPPLDFHPTRQLHSAEIARGLYYATLPGVPAWQRDFAITGQLRRGLIEPQVLETVSAWLFHIVGGEELWAPRVLSIAFWTLGAWFVYCIARRWCGRVGAVAAAGYLLFSPYAVTASRAFMPDPLMVCLLCGAAWAASRWVTTRPGAGTWPWAALTGALAGAGLFIKPVAGFFLAPFLAVLVLRRFGRDAFGRPEVWLAGLLTVLPLASYLVVTTLNGREVLGLGSRFFPDKWTDPAFYTAWGTMLVTVLGSGWAFAGLMGLVLLPQRPLRAGLLGWVVGYLALGFTVSHHMSTHDYYSMPLVPVVALGLGALTAAAWQSVSPTRRGVRAGLVAVLCLALAVGSVVAGSRLAAVDARGQALRWRYLGNSFEPASQIVGLTPDYGHAFTYYGWRSYTWWPTTHDRALMPETADFERYWPQRTHGKDFFLVTDFGQLDAQPDLRTHLLAHCLARTTSGPFWVFDLRDQPACQHPERP